MPQITVWQCPRTATLFVNKVKYKNHLKTTARENIKARKWQKQVDGIHVIIDKIQLVNNMQEWCDYFMYHQETFILYGVLDNIEIKRAMILGHTITFPKLKSIVIKARWDKNVSVTHRCPRDGFTNWGNNDKSLPSGYPGWEGHGQTSYDEDDHHIIIHNRKSKIKIEAPSLKDMTEDWSSSASQTSLNTGSGGGGPSDSKYNVKIFQIDVPNMDKALLFDMVETAGNSNDDKFKTKRDLMGCGMATWFGPEEQL